MKIEQNTPFPKSLTDTGPLSSTKDGVNSPLATSRAPPVGNQTTSATLTPVLPSTHGDFDVARVNQIREDIGAGRYKVNTAKIADGLLATVRDLIGRKTL